jgi:polysaccharide biosynthesis protein PslG
MKVRSIALGSSRSLALALLAIAFGAACALALSARHRLTDWVPQELRHELVAIHSQLSVPRLDTADSTPTWPRVSNPLGVNTFLEQEPDLAVRLRTFQMLRDARVGWIRQEFPWKDIEQQARGSFVDRKFGTDTWIKYDGIVELAEQHQVRVIARLSTSPVWAHPNVPGDDLTPPDDLQDFGNFAAAVARRYRGRIAAYQVWNEPNLDREWGNRPVNAGEYVRLLEVAYRRIKEEDPDALVLSAALAPTIEQSDRALSDLIYLQQMYDAGAGDYFDVMGVQAYGLRHGPDDYRLDFGDVNFSRTLRIREILVRNGDAEKPLWASEVGWNAAPADLPFPNDYGSVSEELQARYTVRAFERARTQWPWMGVMAVWFFKRADASEAQQPWFYFRLVDPDLSPRPVFDALGDYARGRGLVLPSSLERAP